jgi:hypothetical protein
MQITKKGREGEREGSEGRERGREGRKEGVFSGGLWGAVLGLEWYSVLTIWLWNHVYLLLRQNFIK